MGLDNRDYIRDEQRRYSQGGGLGFGGGGGGPMSITTIIIIINVAIFFLDAFTPNINPDPDGAPVHWLSRFLAMDTEALWRVWAYLTHGFAHAGIDSDIGIMHLAGNMITLFFLGRYVEMSLGRQEYLKFYLFAILFSGIVFVVSRILRNDPAVCLGASGAVTAVVALFIFMYPKVTVLLFFIVPMPAWVVGVLLVGMDLYRAFEPETVIAWEAHLAGAAFGCLYYLNKWRFSWLDLTAIGKLFSRRPNLRIHNPDAKFEKLKREADRVLAKINEQGEESLTAQERKTLNRYSKELRNRRQ